LSFKEIYIEKMGEAFILRDEIFPDYIIQMDASRHTALIEIEKLKFDIIWKPFTLKKVPEEGLVNYDMSSAYNSELIERAISVLTPDEYGLYEDFDKDRGKPQHLLVLRKGRYGIIISPTYITKDEKKEMIPLEKIIKKAPKSVFVL